MKPIEFLCEGVKVEATGLDTMQAVVTGVSIDEILNNFDIKDVIEHYGASDMMDALTEMREEDGE
jgi:ribosomal protein L12E/L44/L45/RPP1/RPP2